MYKKAILGLALITLAALSCKKDNSATSGPDTSAPVISLNGGAEDTVSLNTAYTDPGASATDNKDGNISANVVVTGSVNKDLVGEYRLFYNVKDAAGNAAAQTIRYIYVKNDASYLAGDYNAAGTCTTGTNITHNNSNSITVSASATLNNRIIVDDGTKINTDVNANGTIVIPQQAGQSGYTLYGTGTLAASKTTFTLNTTTTYNTTSYNCSFIYTKR